MIGIVKATMEKLQTIATFLRKQLAEIEEKIAITTSQTEFPELTIAYIRKEISSMSHDKGWKSYVEDEYGVVTNIVGILDENYDDIRKFCIVIGRHGSNKWRLFQISVIKKLLNPIVFDPEYTYEDTADGCDEVVMNTAYELAAGLLSEVKSVP